MLHIVKQNILLLFPCLNLVKRCKGPCIVTQKLDSIRVMYVRSVIRVQGKRAAGSGYTRAYTLSPELAAVVGADEMPRHEVVRKIWAIIKEKNLYVSIHLSKHCCFALVNSWSYR